MAAELREMLGAGRERVMHVKPLDAAARALCHVAVNGKQDDGLVICFDEARSDDADDARVPALAREHDGGKLVHVLPCQLLFGTRKDVLLDGLPLLIQRIETVSELLRLGDVLRQEQPGAEHGRRHAARGIEARRELEADLLGRDRGGIDTRDIHEGAQAEILRLCHVREAETHDLAVFAEQRHDVGDRAERDEFEPLLPRLVAERQRKRVAKLEKLERNADAAEVLVRIHIIFAMRVHDGAGGRQCIARQMVVGHDDVELSLQARHVLDRRNATVNGNEQRRCFRNLFERRTVEAIAFAEAVRDVDVGIGAERTQAGAEQCRRRHAVDVVVAIDRDMLAALDGLRDAGDGLLHVLHEERVIEVLQMLGVEEALRVVDRPQAAVPEQPREHI